MEPAERAPFRLRAVGTRACDSVRRVERAWPPARCAGLLAHPPARRTGADLRELGAGGGAIDRLCAHHARQMAVRRLPAVLDQRGVRLARQAVATAAGTEARISRVVAGHRLRLS